MTAPCAWRRSRWVQQYHCSTATVPPQYHRNTATAHLQYCCSTGDEGSRAARPPALRLLRGPWGYGYAQARGAAQRRPSLHRFQPLFTVTRPARSLPAPPPPPPPPPRPALPRPAPLQAHDFEAYQELLRQQSGLVGAGAGERFEAISKFLHGAEELGWT